MRAEGPMRGNIRDIPWTRRECRPLWKDRRPPNFIVGSSSNPGNYSDACRELKAARDGGHSRGEMRNIPRTRRRCRRERVSAIYLNGNITYDPLAPAVVPGIKWLCNLQPKNYMDLQFGIRPSSLPQASRCFWSGIYVQKALGESFRRQNCHLVDDFDNQKYLYGHTALEEDEANSETQEGTVLVNLPLWLVMPPKIRPSRLLPLPAAPQLLLRRQRRYNEENVTRCLTEVLYGKGFEAEDSPGSPTEGDLRKKVLAPEPRQIGERRRLQDREVVGRAGSRIMRLSRYTDTGTRPRSFREMIPPDAEGRRGQGRSSGRTYLDIGRETTVE
ncbi:hypothetical protein B0H11DRAFT_2433716 [Mycena galericulata]|nr:hypothetical protein B0H11DRAFT_2433716 [Mycena galericulata]